MQPYLALITPLSGGHPDQGLPPWQGGYPDQGLPVPPGQPSHPIVLPGAPPGSPGSPSHPIYVTGNPSHPIYVPGYPSHPMAPGGTTPPWGINIDQPDQGLPVPPDLVEGLPPPPGELADKVVVAVYRPDYGWVAKSYDNARVDAGLPPHAQPKT